MGMVIKEDPRHQRQNGVPDQSITPPLQYHTLCHGFPIRGESASGAFGRFPPGPTTTPVIIILFRAGVRGEYHRFILLILLLLHGVLILPGEASHRVSRKPVATRQPARNSQEMTQPLAPQPQVILLQPLDPANHGGGRPRWLVGQRIRLPLLVMTMDSYQKLAQPLQLLITELFVPHWSQATRRWVAGLTTWSRRRQSPLF